MEVSCAKLISLGKGMNPKGILGGLQSILIKLGYAILVHSLKELFSKKNECMPTEGLQGLGIKSLFVLNNSIEIFLLRAFCSTLSHLAPK